MKCDISKCHGACCYNVPIDKGYLSAYKKRIARPILHAEKLPDGMVMPFTDNDPAKNACPFLNEHYRCNIYEVRPKVCRLYGTGEKFLNCEFLTGKSISTEDVVNGLLQLNATNPSLFQRILS